ncbi:hypothetical protein N7508_010031 [Penicillium antarcticum]|uniref:uncharacterized protein n=1 Tax=Penicillium antarcticum TaxID=416450 RepID=UPI002385C538|nr:uncharacterized protein N7508_010031 [Penicillium antarcticum]KAJ5295210.1 hypothetical protein N7508_010031 [Penicillium antarcticum]
MGDSLTDSILSILKERDILAKRDAIESAFGGASANTEWALKHLRPETLLSKEELALYSRLEASGALQPILCNPDLPAARPVLEDDLRNAIESLEASTVTIQKQTETLKFQCDSLNKQLGLAINLEQQRNRDVARLRKKHEGGRQNTTMAASELSDELEVNFKNATDKSSTESKRILASLSTRLKQDDKTLASLESLVSGVKYRGNDASTVTRTNDLSAMLADYVAEEIHYRLDRLYLETVQAGGTGAKASAGETSAALEEELESLYPEIGILAEMSIRQQFSEPILRELLNEHGKLRMASQESLEQALDTLIEMTLSKQDLTKQMADRLSSSVLLDQLAALYQIEAGEIVTQPSSRRDSLRRRSLQPGLLLTAKVPAAPTIDQPALGSILRRVGVISESVLRPKDNGGNGGISDLHEKRIQMSETLGNLKGAVDSPVLVHLSPSDSASQLLRSALTASCHYETSLHSTPEEQRILDLESEVVRLQTGIQGLNMDILHQRDKIQDRVLQRWT